MSDHWNKQEAKRLEAVKALGILDTPQESDFDEIVKLASMIFKVPISTVTILDAHRQWFKAAKGLDVRETPRGISFCTHAIELNDPLIVEDAKKDRRFSNNPLVLNAPNVRFYAGVPLRNSENLAIGTFCIMDKVPRTFLGDELAILKILANQVMKLLELRHERNWLKQLLDELDRVYKTMRDSEQRWKFALEGSGDGVWDWKVGTDEMFFSRRWKEMLGYEDYEFPNHYESWRAIVHPEDIAELLGQLQNHLDGKSDSFRMEYRVQRKDGSWFWVLTRGLVVERDNAGNPRRMVGTHSDITQRKESEELIWRQANFDTLTALPNRRMFFDRLSAEVKRAARAKQTFAVMFIDLDGFKEVNDEFGHKAGDELLIQVSQRLEACIRESDISARLGGDEFTIVLSNLENALAVDGVANKILQALNQPFALGKKRASVSSSIGVAIFPAHGKDADSLLSHADSAMYEAKDKGKNCWVMYDPTLTK
ncbi:MAG: hypothetical protein CVU35_04725 [Betaproteobacteria bacterium HGW-Betaproteobacteria-8]|nr:MAG: hypothetical protein CVU35_04725 [Betaproteobacteria bacterium HGW-Betaproteobacteria-8]